MREPAWSVVALVIAIPLALGVISLSMGAEFAFEAWPYALLGMGLVPAALGTLTGAAAQRRSCGVALSVTLLHLLWLVVMVGIMLQIGLTLWDAVIENRGGRLWGEVPVQFVLIFPFLVAVFVGVPAGAGGLVAFRRLPATATHRVATSIGIGVATGVAGPVAFILFTVIWGSVRRM